MSSLPLIFVFKRCGDRSMQYMIHSSPKRIWYVERYLIPSMLDQGIRRENIEVWNDVQGQGNLVSCMGSFADCGKRTGGTWHLQDDVIICHDFAKRTADSDEGVVCGFCCEQFEATTKNVGEVEAGLMWYSFQCIRIPNQLAGECADWFYNDASKRQKYRFKVQSNKYDDTFWKDFMSEIHGDMKVTNLAPNLVDHIDFVIGGSLVNKQRGNRERRAFYFEDAHLVEELKRAVNKWR